MALVHMVSFDLAGIKFLQKQESAQAKHNLLRQAIALIASVQGVSQAAVEFTVLREIGIEQKNGNDLTGNARNYVLPCADRDRAAFDLHHDPWTSFRELVLGVPVLRLFKLVSSRIQDLAEVALAIGQSDRYYRRAQVGSRAERVTCKNSEAPGIRRNVRFQSNFH